MYRSILKLKKPSLTQHRWRKLISNVPVNCNIKSEEALSIGVSARLTELEQGTSGDKIIQHKLRLLQKIVDDCQANEERSGKHETSYILQGLQAVLTPNLQWESSLTKNQIFKILYSENCQHLLNTINLNLRFIPVNELTIILKVCKAFHIPEDRVIIQNILQLLRCTINELKFHQIMILLTVLRGTYDSTPLGNAVCNGLCILLAHRFKTEIDPCDIRSIASTFNRLVRGHIDDLVPAVVDILYKNLEKITTDDAVKVLRSMLATKCTMKRALMLEKVQDLLYRHCSLLTAKDILFILNGMPKDTLFRTTPKQDSEVVELLTTTFFSCEYDQIQLTLFLQKLAQLRYVSKQVLDFLNLYFREEGSLNFSQDYLTCNFEFVTSSVRYISMADVKLDCLDNVRKLILNSPIPDRDNLTLMHFTFNLLSLDCYHKDLIKKIFSTKIPSTTAAFEFMNLYKILKSLHPNTNVWPSDELLKNAIGMIETVVPPTFEKVRNKNIVSLNGLALRHLKTKKIQQNIDYVMVVDKFHNVVPINSVIPRDQLVEFVEDLELPNPYRSILCLACPTRCYHFNRDTVIGTFQLTMRSLEAETLLPVVPLNRELIKTYNSIDLKLKISKYLSDKSL